MSIYFKQNNFDTCNSPAHSISSFLYLLKRGTGGTNKPFSLLFCCTLNVPQVANNMQLFLPEMDPSQDSEPGMYVRVLSGVFLGSRNWQTTGLGNTREQWAEGNPEPSKSSLGQSIPAHLSNAERAT